MRRFEQKIVELLEPRGLPDFEVPPSRFMIRAWLWATPFLLFMQGLYLLNGMHMQAVVQLFTIVAAASLLVGVRLGLPLRWGLDGSLTIVLLSFVGTSLGQTPFDPSPVFFLSIVPLAAGFTGGFWRGVVWAFICAVLGVITLALGHAGFHSSDLDPNIALTMSLNFIFQLALTVFYAKNYTEEREISLMKARAADRAKSVFLANVSHEIRTPMNGVVGMTEVLLQGELTADQRAQLEVVQRSGQALVLLINDLLDLARLEEGRLELVLVRFDLKMLISDLAKLYEPLASAKGIGLKCVVAEDVPRAVRGDALRLRQVLSNLLSNAVKFTPKGEVLLKVDVEQHQVRFSVVDTGPGISESVRPRLFTRFEQGDASATRRAGGTGLGLALSREFVRLMGGSLLHDASFTQGSRFTFSVELPPEALTDSQSQPPVSNRNEPRASKPVLVVDDNPVNLAVARSLVGRAGYQVHTVANGREALQAVQTSTWSLVLMDVQMPEMDGLEATRQIRALQGPEGRVPIVALTASAMPEDLTACLQAGMNEVLAKPIDVKALQSVLHRLIEN